MLCPHAFHDLWPKFTTAAFGSLLIASVLTGCGQKKEDKSHRFDTLTQSDTVTPRTWRSEQHGFEVTIPSQEWNARVNPNVLALFGASDFTAIVAEARPAQSDSEWLAALNFAQSMRLDRE